MPGAANRVFELAEAELEATNDVRVRTAKAEQFATVLSSVAAPSVQLLSLIATVYLAVTDNGSIAALTAIPFVGLSIAQLTIRFGRRSDE